MHTPRSLQALMDAHGLHATKALGQNFLHDANTARRIARLARVNETDHVVEIGAGLGSLTLALVETGATITAIEFDKYLIPVLTDLVGQQAKVIHGDALALDWDAIIDPTENAVVVANLPYNVGTGIVTMLLEKVPQAYRMVVMLQKEVAQRMCAVPHTKAYGALTLKIAYFANASIVGTVPRTVFLPQPDIDSALIEIQRREHVATEAPFAPLFSLIHKGFLQRRKMLRSAVSCLTQREFDAASIAPTSRAEDLTIEDWGRLTLAYLDGQRDA